MTVIVFYRDGRIEVIEDVRSVSDSFVSSGFDIDPRDRAQRESVDAIKIEVLP